MQSKRTFSWFRLLMVMIIAYFGYVGVEQQININNIDQERSIAEVRLAEAKKMNQELQEEKSKLGQAEYVERIAREELGLVKKGEIPYISSNNS